MLLKLVELRSSDWGRVRAISAASNATPDNDPNYFMVSVKSSWGLACAREVSYIVKNSPYILYSYPPIFILCSVSHGFYFVSSQNEPTFYTQDGTPFTAADPGKVL